MNEWWSGAAELELSLQTVEGSKPMPWYSRWRSWGLERQQPSEVQSWSVTKERWEPMCLDPMSSIDESPTPSTTGCWSHRERALTGRTLTSSLLTIPCAICQVSLWSRRQLSSLPRLTWGRHHNMSLGEKPPRLVLTSPIFYSLAVVLSLISVR